MPHRIDVGLDDKRTRRVRTGPLPQVPWSALEPAISIERRLSQLFVIGFVLLLAIQIWLRS